MSTRTLVVGGLIAGILLGCGDNGRVMAPIVIAPDQPILAFDEAAAVAANGTFPKAEPKAVCGADDRRFLAELAEGNPLDFRVPKRLADINPPPSVVMVSGRVRTVSLGGGDFPFDHTFGSDLNADVVLDEPYTEAAQEFGIVGGELHIELAEGQLPHEQRPPGPPEGQEWEEMSRLARVGIHGGFVPEEDARVAVMGHWIVDCGHTNFQTELHPIIFLATGEVVEGRTVVHAFYNPYRETQLYHFDPSRAVAFEDPSRFEGVGWGSFPLMLLNNILRLQDLGPEPFSSVDHLESWAMLEAEESSPVEWRVCAPPGSRGSRLVVTYHWITRPGVEIEVAADEASSCAVVRSRLGTSVIVPPTPRVCVLPWEFLNRAAAEEAGIEGLDLQEELGAFVLPEFRYRLEPAPILNCYDPLSGPLLEQDPTGQRIDVDEDILLPFYGTITVGRL